MQEALAAHFVRRGLLASCGVRREGTCSPPCGLGLDATSNINLNKDGARPFGRALCIFSRTLPAVRYVGVGAACIFGSILQPKALAYCLSGKNGVLRCPLRISGGAMGCRRSSGRDIRRLRPLLRPSETSGLLNTPKNARRLEGDLREKGNRPVEVCIRRGGLCI